MLYYADGTRQVELAASASGIATTLRRLAAAFRATKGDRRLAMGAHADLVGAAIEFGELHQALADFLNPEADETSPSTDQLTRLATLLGACVYISSRQLGLTPPVAGAALARARSLPGLLAEAASCVEALDLAPFPAVLDASIPEGYAYYSLYPEMYFAALARAIAARAAWTEYTVIGIRSIGTSLSGLVAGALTEAGYRATAETIRPRGHPFDRFVRLGPDLSARLASGAKKVGFLVVDEGPGLTCSSFLSVCSALHALGAREDQVAILSAWEGAPSIYASNEIRERWRRARVFHVAAAEAFHGWRSLVPFVEQAAGTAIGRGGRHAPDDGIVVEDLSYGRWRELLYHEASAWPAVHRPSERTKLLFAGLPHSSLALLAKFAGLGRYGREKLERARALADAGFAPPVLGLAYGFQVYAYVDGRPLSEADCSDRLLARLVQYYSFISTRFSRPAEPRFDFLAGLIATNVPATLDLDAGPFVTAWRSRQAILDSLPLAQLDGRPQPHEWLMVALPDGLEYLKTDGADHFRDHTLVGEQSILWDLAGAVEEWDMDEERSLAFLHMWVEATGDHVAASLLPFYRLAYLAFRAAGLHYAIHSTNEEEIRRGLQHQQWKLNQRIPSLLAARP